MYYLDTSVVAALFLPQQSSSTVLRWLAAESGAELFTSSWHLPEFASVLARLVRMRLLAAAPAEATYADFQRWLRQTAILVPVEADFESAATLVRDPGGGLRAPDALHLAMVRRHGALTLMTLDSAMAKAARRFGFRVGSL